MGVGNQGGFRTKGSAGREKVAVLYSTLDDPDWPDHLDLHSGVFTYHGDNKKAGHELHATPRGGNTLLRRCFADLHCGRRSSIPPFFAFTKGEEGRDVIFRGLAVPGVEGRLEDLVTVWKSSDGLRFKIIGPCSQFWIRAAFLELGSKIFIGAMQRR
jgi:Restriction endonuclease AspBHI N-terminal